MLYGVARYRKNEDGSLDEESELLLDDTVTPNGTRVVIDAATLSICEAASGWAYRAVSFDTLGIPLRKV